MVPTFCIVLIIALCPLATSGFPLKPPDMLDPGDPGGNKKVMMDPLQKELMAKIKSELVDKSLRSVEAYDCGNPESEVR